MIKIGITQGDINGISYEVILKAFSDSRLLELCTPILYGSSKVMGYHRKSMELAQVNYHTIKSPQEAKEGHLNLINVSGDEEVKVEFGKSTPISGQAAFLSLERASADLKDRQIDVLLTSPINKENIQSKEFEFPGHTEYLQAKFGGGRKALMLLVKENIRIAVYTGHIPLSAVSGALNKTDLVNKIKLLSNSLSLDFGIQKPRIAVLALNPHSGDNGVIGNEENEIIIPAMELAKQQGINCFGPFAADGFFGSESYLHYDGVLAMYHDQGLIPFKTLAMDMGVNFTAGLNIVRTSPAHGTAYDIAGQNKASECSFIQALYLAIDVYRNRQRAYEASANPLRKQFFEKNKEDEKLVLTETEA